jgi:hypothetical protein
VPYRATTPALTDHFATARPCLRVGAAFLRLGYGNSESVWYGVAMTSSQYSGYKQRSSYASDAQINFINKLRAERSYDAGPKLRALFVAIDASNLVPAADARMAIDSLKECPYLQPKVTPGAVQPEPPKVEIGYYLNPVDDHVYKVQASKNNPDRRYAKKLVLPPRGSHSRAQWVYQPGAMLQLAGLTTLTVEDAVAIANHLDGYCFACGARLDDPQSVQRGLGPVCYKRVQKGGAA